MGKLLRELDLKFEGPPHCHLRDLFLVVLTEFSSSARALEIAKWLASHHLRFLKSLCSIALFDFIILLLSTISTAVLNPPTLN